MKQIGVLIDDFYEDIEYTEPSRSFKEAGYNLIVIGTDLKLVTGKKRKSKVKIQMRFCEVDPADYDAIMIPGGYSPDRLRANDLAVRFVQMYVKLGRPIFMICHGPQLLITADVLKGRMVTGYKSIIQDIKNAGAIYIDRPVVVDRNFVSSRNPDDLPHFIQKSLEKLS